MLHWLAGLTAAAAAWLINRYLVARAGERAVIWLVPPVEELLKTGLAIMLGASLPLSHGVFGLLEAVYDYLASARWGFWAGLSSIGSHYLLGLCTLFVYKALASWVLSIGLASLLHVLWNLAMIRYLAPLLERRPK